MFWFRLQVNKLSININIPPPQFGYSKTLLIHYTEKNIVNTLFTNLQNVFYTHDLSDVGSNRIRNPSVGPYVRTI